jgi:putative IMPACT (imprinted ancient) family translation regulator
MGVRPVCSGPFGGLLLGVGGLLRALLAGLGRLVRRLV